MSRVDRRSNATRGTRSDRRGRRGARTALAALAALALAATLAACGSSSSSSSGSDGGSGSGSTKQITVALPFQASSFAPLYLAIDRGYFRDAGLDVKLVALNGGANVVKGLVSGSVDIGLVGLADDMTAVLQRQPLKVFYSTFNQPLYSWYARDPAIRTMADAKGKTVAVSQPGGSMDQITRYALTKVGLDPRSDVKIRTNGENAAIVAALRVGQADIAGTTAESGSLAEAAGAHRVEAQADLMRQYANGASTATQQYIDDNSDTVQAYLTGLVKGVREAQADPDAAKEAMEKYAKISPEAAADAYEQIVSKTSADGRLPDAESMDAFWQIGKLAGQWTSPVPESQWLDSRWIDSYPSWVGQSGD
ncbi:MAG TPA: ABC transporter substrate-binding protein [Conexibacter sp.]|jgi:NitT/TauT family transport system substrate-binding protein